MLMHTRNAFIDSHQTVQVQEQDQVDRIKGYRGPKDIHANVFAVVERWRFVVPICPGLFLRNLLQSRNYDYSMIPANLTKRSAPTEKQLRDYDKDITTAVRESDLNSLKRLAESGKSMTACNKFSESIVHIACRRSNFEIVDFIVRHGGDLSIADDYGRTPLHDACWRSEPQFDVVTIILDRNIELLRTLDVRGSSPISYAQKEHWLHWCAYLFYQRDKYWPIIEEKLGPTDHARSIDDEDVTISSSSRSTDTVLSDDRGMSMSINSFSS